MRYDTPLSIPRHTIDAERLRTVLERLASGFYDRRDVQDAIVTRLTPDLS